MDNVKIIRMQTCEDIMASMIEKEEQNEKDKWSNEKK